MAAPLQLAEKLIPNLRKLVDVPMSVDKVRWASHRFFIAVQSGADLLAQPHRIELTKQACADDRTQPTSRGHEWILGQVEVKPQVDIVYKPERGCCLAPGWPAYLSR